MLWADGPVLACVTPLSASAETVAEIQAEQNRLQAEKEDLQSQLDDLRNQEAEKQAYQDTLQEQIQVVQEQIDTTRQNIDDLNQSITELTMKLDASQAEIQDTIDEFKERLVALYTAGNVSTLEILLDSNSLSEFTTRSEMIENMTAHDQDLVDKLEAYVASTSAEREERQAQMEEVAELKKSLENQQDELDSLYAENAAALEEIQGRRVPPKTPWLPTRKSWPPMSRKCRRPSPPRRPRKRPPWPRSSSKTAAPLLPAVIPPVPAAVPPVLTGASPTPRGAAAWRALTPFGPCPA